MIAVAFDTTSDHLTVAARNASGRVVSRSLDGARRHASALLPLIAELGAELGVDPRAIDTLILADGPGSFTGLRVGASVMKALARGLAAPPAVWVVSTLLARAAGASGAHGARVLVATPALRDEVYAARYRLDLPRTVETLDAPAVTLPDLIPAEAVDLLVADLPAKLLDRLVDRLQVPAIRPPLSLPRAEALFDLVGVPGGAIPLQDPDGWEPTYGRPAEAQRIWEVAHGQPLPHPLR
jgi:tRNA threonylcarbamoyl adenosine modification protein YeaZ